jgi:hypothetical protein
VLRAAVHGPNLDVTADMTYSAARRRDFEPSSLGRRRARQVDVRKHVRSPTFGRIGVHGRSRDGAWEIRCPLWTREEGRSDLEMQATANEVFDGIWQVDVDDVLVP